MSAASSLILLCLLCAAVYKSWRYAFLPFSLTLGGSLAGMLCALVLPQSSENQTPWLSLIHSLSGFFTGFLAAWLLLEIGKSIFGRVTFHYDPSESWSVIQADPAGPPCICIGNEIYAWTDVFTRTSDCLSIDCDVLNVGQSSYENTTVELRSEILTIRTPQGAQTQPLSQVSLLNGVTSKVIMPREFMGFGVVFLIAMIGSFLGAAPALYILGASLILLVLYFLMRSNEAVKTEIAPFTLLASVAYIALKHHGVLE